MADAIGVADAGPKCASEPSAENVPEEPFEPFSGPRPESPREGDRVPFAVSLVRSDVEVDLEGDSPGPMVGDVRRISADVSAVRPGPDRIHEGRIAARRRQSRERAILSRIEGLDVRRGRRWASHWCIVLLLLLVLQHAWFMAGDLAGAFPVLGPVLDEFCAVAGCETQRRAGDDGIRVVSRTVRPHAEYSSALSVQATLENRSSATRPFPVVVFVLYGRDGRAVASRAFEPAEYLDGGAVPSGGLESGRQVDIAFDLVAPAEVAVSFELSLI